MDEAAVEKAGAAPLKPTLDAIAALQARSATWLPLLARLHLDTAAAAMLFGFGSNQDFADSNQVIAFASAPAASGLPDRDYYVKTDAKSRGDRARSTWRTCSRCSSCSATRRPTRQGGSADRDGDRDRAGQGVADARGAARSLQAVPQDARATQLHGADAVASAGTSYLAAMPDWPSVAKVNVTEPAFYKELEAQLKTRSPRRLEDLPALARGARAARRIFRRRSWRRTSTSTASTCAASSKCSRAGSAACSYVDRDLGEALGQVFVEKTFAPGREGSATLAMTKRDREGDGGGHAASSPG